MSGRDLSTKEKGKKMAQNFLYKLADSFDVKKPDTLPKPPPKPARLGYSRTPSASEDIISMFDNLTLSNIAEYDRTSSVAPFIGGFRPITHGSFHETNPANIKSASVTDLPIPLGMPSPYSGRLQSLTMQMALKTGQNVPYVNCVHSSPLPSLELAERTNLLIPLQPSSSSSSSTTVVTANTGHFPSVPIQSNKSEFSITTPTPSGKAVHVQCSGRTKAGKRCTRKVKAKAPIAAPALEDVNELNEYFCYQHAKELLEPTGFYARNNNEWVKFEDWIPPYLQPETQVSLRVEMNRARSQSDVPGYIYTFEIREEHEKETIKLKVGRAVNLVKRIDQWGKQCGSKEQVLRGFYPENVENDHSLMKGRVRAGEKGPWCHRLERLVHIELGDLAASSIYLDPAWPNPEPIMESSAKDKIIASETSSNAKTVVTPCLDCGSIHKEIFEFRRWKTGGNQGKEWERLVKPVIERWGMFVELYI